jgi:PleD family two-component response regulator
MDNKKRILIVDDDEVIRTMYAEVFRNEGYEVEEAIDGLDGLEKATGNPPSIIFTGIMMPRMDGFQFKEALSKNVATADIPVVMSSHMGRKEDQDRAREMGVKDFIVQGMVTPREAIERIEGVFGAREYRVRIMPREMDAPMLSDDFHFGGEFLCESCGEWLELILETSDLSKREFKARFHCPKCG